MNLTMRIQGPSSVRKLPKPSYPSPNGDWPNEKIACRADVNWKRNYPLNVAENKVVRPSDMPTHD